MRHPLRRGFRNGDGWFARVRLVMVLAIATVAGLALAGSIAVTSRWISPAMSSWFAFSLLPLAGLVVLQTATRAQEALTMRFGGRPVAVEDR